MNVNAWPRNSSTNTNSNKQKQQQQKNPATEYSKCTKQFNLDFFFSFGIIFKYRFSVSVEFILCGILGALFFFNDNDIRHRDTHELTAVSVECTKIVPKAIRPRLLFAAFPFVGWRSLRIRYFQLQYFIYKLTPKSSENCIMNPLNTNSDGVGSVEHISRGSCERQRARKSEKENEKGTIGGYFLVAATCTHIAQAHRLWQLYA